MLVELRNVRAMRGSGRARREVLRDVSLSVAEGEICGLLGPNGAGKSTTIAVIAGLLPATGGVVSLFGSLPPGEALAPHYGVLPEQNGCYDWMTAFDYLDFFLRLHGRRLVPADIAARLRQVGLEAAAHRQPIRSFSQGMRQRLGLARALVNDPALLILDEPTAGLDPRGRRDVHDLLIGLSGSRGVGVLLCTHLLDDVDRLCQRVAIIGEGRTLCEARVEEIRADATSLEALYFDITETRAAA